MAEQIALNWTDPNSVRKIIRVKAPQDIAWRVFTEQMATWWPLAVYKIGKANAVDAIIEPRVGGRWYDAARMAAPATGAPCSPGSPIRGWCSPGTSTPTSSTIQN